MTGLKKKKKKSLLPLQWLLHKLFLQMYMGLVQIATALQLLTELLSFWDVPFHQKGMNPQFSPELSTILYS